MKRVSDFRSDTVTRPTSAMLAAMVAAELGDDVLDGDPTVRRLERAVAALLEKPEAILLPSGTMANQVAVGAWTRPGDELVAERSMHVVQWEAGAVAALHGVQTLTLHAEDGRLDLDELAHVIHPGSIHSPRTALVCVEQTFMGSGDAPGGRIVPLAHVEAIHTLARARGAAVHLDGARLWNAAAGSGVVPARWAAAADSVSVALSKGLGAPIGALVAGPAEFVERARVWRKRLGGWMRQAGVIAGAGLFALERNRERLGEDHALARNLAEVLATRSELEAWPREVETNIVMARVEDGAWTPETLAARLEEESVLVLPMGARSLRFCTHMDVGPEDVERLDRALGRILG